MKYLKNFKHFENVEVNVTDEPDVKLAKEETNQLEKSIRDFPAVKSELDRAFMNLKSNKDNELLNKKIDEIKKKFPSNPFISQYTRMMNLQMRIKYVQDELVKYNDDLYKNEEDLKQLAAAKADTTAKTKTINDIKSNQTIKTQEIVKLKKDLAAAEAEQKKKMADIKKEIEDSSKKITSF
jgi:hypothetical protein